LIGFVTGLTAEARLLAGFNVLVVATGGSPGDAEAVAFRLIDRGATALISFGLAGGLDPGLKAGSLLIPHCIVDGEAAYKCDECMIERLGGATEDRLTGAQAIAVTVDAKAALRRATGAAAVDLESVGVARAAMARGLPFAVLRAVADPAERALPPASLVALDALGRIRFGRVFGSIVRQPDQIIDLIRLARDASAGRRTLARHVRQHIRDL
jgi:adenosylhomocysteine nucleosidase